MSNFTENTWKLSLTEHFELHTFLKKKHFYVKHFFARFFNLVDIKTSVSDLHSFLQVQIWIQVKISTMI